jgi:hypothetical protein
MTNLPDCSVVAFFFFFSTFPTLTFRIGIDVGDLLPLGLAFELGNEVCE